MQIKKEDIRKRVLVIAKNEFLQHGFKNASMRTIAKEADVGLGNIYNYFKNKNEIFLQLVSPLIDEIDEMFESHNYEENLTLEIFISQTYQEEAIAVMVNLIENFKDELKLLLFHSYGSSLQNYRDDYADSYTRVSLEFLDNMKERYPHLNTSVSEFFIHTLCSWMFTIIGEIIAHEDVTHGEIEAFMKEYVAFSTAGWKAVLKA